MLQTWLAYIIIILLLGTILFVIRRYELNKKKRETEEKIKRERERILLQEAELKVKTAQARTLAAEAEKEMEKYQMRHNIAADLHDEIGSNLSSIVVLCDLMQENCNIDKKTFQKFSEIRQIARLSAECMRDIIWFINPENDQFENLVFRIKDMAATMLGKIKLNFIISEVKLLENVNLQFKRNLYLFFKEIIHNIIKHSEATCSEIELKEIDHNLILRIRDNGRGFDIEEVTNGDGLLNIKNRASKIGGIIEIESAQNRGTMIKLKAKIP
jgi:signal transduction histidine kinase